jgi:DNA modification methylase
LMCGDATSAEDVERLLDGAKPHLMVTDPPWGVEHDPKWRDETGLTRTKQTSIGLVQNDDRSDWSAAYDLFPGDVAYVWHAGVKADLVGRDLARGGFEIRSQIVWAKQAFVFGRGHYHQQHEPCWYAVRRGTTGHWNGDRKQTSLWEIDNSNRMKGGSVDDVLTGHSTQKPIECMKRPIENNSQPGDAVYDPFVGSGTTLIAAEITGRKALGLEIDTGYCDVIINRWQDLTTKEARHAVSSLTYAEERDARAKPARKRKRAPAAA